jgi:hypothetical protein
MTFRENKQILITGREGFSGEIGWDVSILDFLHERF